MFGLKIFVRVQTFRRVPPVLPCNFCHPDNNYNQNRLFAGMEAPTVILITKTLGTNETAVRSGMLRAVAKLIVITDSADLNIKNIEQHFDVTRMKDFNSISDSDDEL